MKKKYIDLNNTSEVIRLLETRPSSIICRDEYKETIEGLNNELKEMGMTITFSMQLIIEQIAIIVVILRTIRYYFAGLPIVTDTVERKLGSITRECHEKKSLNYYEFQDAHTIYPLFEEHLLKMQKRLVYLLDELGLSPKQQIVREKIKIISKLDKKLIDIKTKDSDYKVKAICEKEVDL